MVDLLPAMLLRLRDLLAQGLKTIQVLQAVDGPRIPTAREEAIHAVPTLALCLTGVVRISTLRSRFDLLPGEVLLIAPGAWHEHHQLRAGSALYGQGFVGKSTDLVIQVESAHHIALAARDPARRLLQRALVAPGEERPRAVAEAIERSLASPTRTFGSMPPAVARMAQRLWWEPPADLSVDEVVRVSGLGRTQAHAQFKAWFGVTPLRLLTDQRLAWAVESLRQGSTVGEAAERAGFCDRIYLTRAFTARFGVPPRRWREVDLAQLW